MEYHIYESINHKRITSMFSCLHRDDNGGVGFKVNTVIFYFENTFKIGGELFIEDDTPIAINKQQKNEYSHYIIDPRRFNCVALSGNVSHKILDVIGVGVRRCLVVQIRDRTR
ncbi:hypothetical protein EBX93_17655 [bacterium]|nr:hypothetical protein [bacterium]